MPLEGSPSASKLPMNKQEIQDLVCILKTLTDGIEIPAKPATSGPCVN
jgi:hypothetical protein